MYVNDEMTINGKWLDDSNVAVWCVNGEGVVGMTGSIVLVKDPGVAADQAEANDGMTEEESEILRGL